MIRLHGPDGSPEWAAAEKLSSVILAEWPYLQDDTQSEVHIIVSAKCWGQAVEDIDLLVFGKFQSRGANQYAIGATHVVSVALAIELKGHTAGSFRFNGSKLEVDYKGKWHDASEQSNKQKYAVRNYITESRVNPPYVSSCIWMQFVPSSTLPVQRTNVFGSDASWSEFMSAISIYRGTFDAFGNGNWQGTVDLFLKKLTPSPLDRKKIEKISRRVLSGQQYHSRLGQQLLIFRGRGGTGKTARLLQMSHDLYKENEARILILTYNLALVADIKRLFALMGVGTSFGGSGIHVQSVMSFLRSILLKLEIIEDSQPDFIKRYDQYIANAVEWLEAVTLEDKRQLITDYPEDYDWDYIFVDESQDWPQNERTILFELYDFRKFVLADGIDQFVRSNQATQWRHGLGKDSSQVVSLRRSLRLKSGLCGFVNLLADKLGLTDWSVEAEPDVHGGRVVVLIGDYFNDPKTHELLLNEACGAGNEYVDMLYCVPPSMVNKLNQVRTSIPGNYFQQWGYEVWDGAASDIRKVFPTSLKQLRIIQYDSCRGLEGWMVTSLAFDDFWQYKYNTFKAPDNAQLNMFQDLEKMKREWASYWLMIPVTRAIDTLVLHISSRDSYIGGLLLECARQMPEIVSVLEIPKQVDEMPW